MRTGERALVLEDLERERPAARGAERSANGAPPALATRSTRAKKGVSRANTTRVSQIAVGTAATKPTIVVEEPDHRHAPVESDQTTAPAPLQRSQTAPTGLKRPRRRANEETPETTPLPARPASRQEPALRPSARIENGRIAVRPVAPRPNSQKDDEYGESTPPPPQNQRLYGEMIDSEDVEALCKRLGLSPKDVWRLRKEFNDEDTDSTNTITVSSFFYLIHEEQRALTRSLLQLAGVASPTAARLTFDEYLRCVVTFSTFTEPELFQFFFRVYCDTTSASGGGPTARSVNVHAMVERDLVKFGQDLQVLRTAFAGNVRVATGDAVAAASQGHMLEGSLTFADFERFSRQHMVAFIPLLQIQRNVRQAAGLGEAFWAQKTSEKLQVQNLLSYMKRNHGFQPPLPLRDRIVRFVLQRQTTQTRVRELAKELYTGGSGFETVKMS